MKTINTYLLLLLISADVSAKEPLKPFYVDKSWYLKKLSLIKNADIEYPKAEKPLFISTKPMWSSSDPVTDNKIITIEPRALSESVEAVQYVEIPKKIVTTQLQDGPPKWIPPELAYWDSSAGDWRFSNTSLEENHEDDLTPQDMIVFGLKYENSDQGLSFNASLNTQYWYGIFRPEKSATP